MSSAILVLVGAAGGLIAAISTLAHGGIATASIAWHLPNAMLAVRLDPLAAAFLLPTFILGAAAAVYGLSYASGAGLRAFMGLLLAGMVTVVIAAHAILFLVAWEVMAVAAFFLIATDDANAEVRGAAWMYLIATHVGTLGLLALFTVLRNERGTFLLGPVSASTSAFVASSILLLALAGFGFKAGIVPLHFWLPGAHANAPSHVSALLSGAMLKVGIYGIVRTLTYLPRPHVWWGALLVAAGLTSALAAISLALGQSDMKRALAYSSIENIGVIVTAIGVSVIGRASALPALAALGLAAAIAHVWNHSLFKGLLFLCAGSVMHATGTRRIDRLGGLLRSMPVTGTLFIVGATSAAALPGTNAFLSEALLYLGFLREAARGGIATIGAALLALIGALAVACFVRLTGMIFLGNPRTEAATHAHESPFLMRLPLAALAVACVAIGLVPQVLWLALRHVTGDAVAYAPFLRAISMPLQILAVLIIATLAALLAITRRSPRQLTWDCGYAQPTARMQYTSGALSEWFTARILPRFLTMSAVTDEPFADRIIRPLAGAFALRAMRLRWLQQGRLPLYLLYIFVTLLAGVAWVALFPLVGGLR